MGTIDILIIVGIALLVAGIVGYMIWKKIKGEKIGCGCGCGSCPHAGACGGKPAQKETDDGAEATPETEETLAEQTASGGDDDETV